MVILGSIGMFSTTIIKCIDNLNFFLFKDETRCCFDVGKLGLQFKFLEELFEWIYYGGRPTTMSDSGPDYTTRENSICFEVFATAIDAIVNNEVFALATSTIAYFLFL